MHQDYKDLLSAFQSHGVKYLVVGGFAVIHHSQPRFTKDMDLFIQADTANAKAIYAALAEFGRLPGDSCRQCERNFERAVDVLDVVRFGLPQDRAKQGNPYEAS